jgi:hypothetical protein
MKGRILAAALAALALAAPVTAQEGGDGTKKAPASPESVARDRLPVLGTVGDLPPEKERVVVELTPAPALKFGGVAMDLRGLRQLLGSKADGLREEKEPHASRLHVVLRADRDVPWQDVQRVMQACADPALRIYRILFAAVPEDGGAEGAIATFLPMDRGLPDDQRPPVWTSLPVHLRSANPLSSSPGPALYVHLEKTFGGLKGMSWAAQLDADPSVSTGAVLQSVDVLLRWGVKVVFFQGTQLNKTGSPAGSSRSGPVVGTPSVILMASPAAEPGVGVPVLALLARATGRMAGQMEVSLPLLLETPPIEEEPDSGAGGGAGGLLAGRRGGHRSLLPEGGAGTESAVEAGLEWLRIHQSPGGRWDCAGSGSDCGGPGGPLFDPGVTGLALLAFLGYGETHKTPRYGAVVRNGLKYLKGIQDAEGCFGPRTSSHFTYNHAIATLAMVEAYGLTLSPLFKSSAQNGVNFVLQCRNPDLAWRYGVKPQDNDTSVTGWMVMALHSARGAGLDVEPAAFTGAMAWLDKATEPEYGRVGYTARGNGPCRTVKLMQKFPGDKSESLTAIGVLARLVCGTKWDGELVKKGTDLCVKALPVWDEAAGTNDFYYWYYGTMAMFQVGGDPWNRWNEAMKKALVPNQRQDPADDRFGSWDPVDPWGADGGRVYGTAINVLSLEVYYRYARIPAVK